LKSAFANRFFVALVHSAHIDFLRHFCKVPKKLLEALLNSAPNCNLRQFSKCLKKSIFKGVFNSALKNIFLGAFLNTA
jgi:hypothetical protein